MVRRNQGGEGGYMFILHHQGTRHGIMLVPRTYFCVHGCVRASASARPCVHPWGLGAPAGACQKQNGAPAAEGGTPEGTQCPAVRPPWDQRQSKPPFAALWGHARVQP